MSIQNRCLRGLFQRIFCLFLLEFIASIHPKEPKFHYLRITKIYLRRSFHLYARFVVTICAARWIYLRGICNGLRSPF